MFPANDQITRRQLVAMGFLCTLSPLIRRLPGRTVAIAGAGAWLSILLAMAPLSLLFLLILHTMRGVPARRGLGGLILDVFGPWVGRAVLGLFTAWFIFAAAFTLRVDADRFITTVFPSSGPAVFIVTMLLACLPAALGQLKALARSAMLFRPILLGVLGLVFAFALPKIHLEGLWQINAKEEISILQGVADAANPLCFCVYLAFLSDQTEPGLKFSHVAGSLAAIVAVAELICLITLGTLGVEMTAKIRNPFFAVIRDLTLFGTVEHVEAILVTIWVFSDFVLVASMLYMAAKNLRLLFNISPLPEKPRPLDMSHGRFLTVLVAALTLVTALLIAPESKDLLPYNNVILPALNLSLAFVGLPLIFLVGRLRRKL